MTHAEVAADIRKHSPGALDGIETNDAGRLCFVSSSGTGDHCTNWHTAMPDRVAEAVLRDAMVMGGQIICSDGWWFAVNPEFGDCMFEYSAHGGSLQACHAAWRWSKGLDTKETT